MQLRRLIPRMAVAWRGLYRLGDEPMGNWRPCSVVDVSTGGAGLELPEGTAEVPPDGESVTVWVELRGTVRTIAPGQRGGVREL